MPEIELELFVSAMNVEDRGTRRNGSGRSGRVARSRRRHAARRSRFMLPDSKDCFLTVGTFRRERVLRPSTL